VELDHVEERLAVLELKFDVIEGNLKAALSYVGDLHRAYSAAGPRVRRQINQAMFKRILVSSDGDIIGELRPPFDLLLRASGKADQDGVVRPSAKDKPRASEKARGLSKQDLVDPVGLEPTASAMPWRRSPS